jgi:hypothetical protein
MGIRLNSPAGKAISRGAWKGRLIAIGTNSGGENAPRCRPERNKLHSRRRFRAFRQASAEAANLLGGLKVAQQR